MVYGLWVRVGLNRVGHRGFRASGGFMVYGLGFKQGWQPGVSGFRGQDACMAWWGTGVVSLARAPLLSTHKHCRPPAAKSQLLHTT